MLLHAQCFADALHDVLVVGHVAELQTLNPAQAVTISDFRLLCNVYDGLLHYKDGSLEVEPGLAESWTVSPDGKSYAFTLRQGVKFHDGTDFDAEAVKFNFDHVLDKTHPYNNTGPFPFVFTLGPITHVEVTGPHVVTLHLSAPYAPALTMLAGAIGGLAGISPTVVKKYGKDAAAMAAAPGRSASSNGSAGSVSCSKQIPRTGAACRS